MVQALDESLIAAADCHHLTASANPIVQSLQCLLDGTHALSTTCSAFDMLSAYPDSYLHFLNITHLALSGHMQALTNEEDDRQILLKTQRPAQLMLGSKLLAEGWSDGQTMHSDLRRQRNNLASQKAESFKLCNAICLNKESARKIIIEILSFSAGCGLACSSFRPLRIALRLQYSVGTKQRSTRGWNHVL